MQRFILELIPAAR